MIPNDLEDRIRRLALVENWPIGTIARELHIHHSVARRVLGRSKVPVLSAVKATIFDPYLPFIRETLERYPRLKASRLHGMLKDRGFRGSRSHLRQLVARLRPLPSAEAYLRLKTLPGEQAQVDWAHFGHLEIGKARRPLVAFLLVLSYSRALYLRFFLDMKQASFLRGHVLAFEFFGAVPRTVLYDNLKSAVLERQGDAIRFHPTMLDFAHHYRFEPRPVAVARGNEKGRVERMVRTVREGFFAARAFKDLDDLNAQALAYCQGEALDRAFVEDKTQTVRDALEAERAHLLPLASDHFPTEESVDVKILKTPYARFDLNDYSVPHDCVMRVLNVRADESRVRILDQGKLVAEHDRSYSRGEQIEDQAHIQALVDEKREARTHRAIDRLRLAARGESRRIRAGSARVEPRECPC